MSWSVVITELVKGAKALFTFLGGWFARDAQAKSEKQKETVSELEKDTDFLRSSADLTERERMRAALEAEATKK